MSKKTPCPDCGPAPTNHLFEKLSVCIRYGIAPVVPPLHFIEKKLGVLFSYPVSKRAAHTLLYALTKIGAATAVAAPTIATPDRTRVLFESAEKCGIKMQEFHLFGKKSLCCVATKNDKIIFFETLPRPPHAETHALLWMDDKSVMRKKFAEAGIPIARGGYATRIPTALDLFHSLAKPVIIKPSLGSRSRHTTIHIQDERDFLLAFKKAKQLSPRAVIEEQLEGFVFRATVIGGKSVAVLRRDPAFVVGDGIHTIRALAELENKNPRRRGGHFHLLPIDETAEQELARQNLSWASIPAAGKYIPLGQKASRGEGIGGGTTDVTRETHPDNVAVFEKVAATLRDPLVGIDFIIADISKSWRDQPRSGVIECNSMPFIDLHHDPLYGEPIDAAGALWDIVFT